MAATPIINVTHMPERTGPMPRATFVVLLTACLAQLLLAQAPSALAQQQQLVAQQQQQPMAVLAVSGLDPLLEDIDHLFAAGAAPQYARQVRDVIAALNELRGLDRQRPLGVYLFYPAAGEKDPQPLLFFPVADIAQLQASLQIGDDLQLQAGSAEDRLTLHTKDGDLPVRVQHQFAFVDPTKTGTRLNQPLPDPAELIADVLEGQDGALLIRREGLPPAIIELVLGQVRAAALQQEPQREDEKDAEFALRTGMHTAIFSLLESAVQEWQGATLRWRLSGEERRAHVEAALLLDQAGTVVPFLNSIRGDSGRFAAQRAGDDAAVSLAVNWQPTPAGRALLEELVDGVRKQISADVSTADTALQEAVLGIVDALEATVTEESSDSFLQLQKRPEGNFVLIGATSIAEADKVALGLDRLLPFAVDSEDIRQIEMGIARSQDVAVHRIHPQKLRSRDRRLYGEDAAVYLAAGRGAVWVAVGGAGTAPQLIQAIQMDRDATGNVQARADSSTQDPHVAPVGQTYVDVVLHGTDLAAIAPQDAPGNAVAALVDRAFDTRQDDRLRLWLQPAADGLRLQIHLEHAYVRLIGLALADRLSRPQPAAAH